MCIRLVGKSLYLGFSSYYIALWLRRYPSGKTTKSVLQSHIGQCARTVCWFAFRDTSACDNTYDHHRPRKTTMGCPYIPLSTSNQVVLGCQAHARNHLEAHADDRVLSSTTTVSLYFTLSSPAYHSYRSHMQETYPTSTPLYLFASVRTTPLPCRQIGSVTCSGLSNCIRRSSPLHQFSPTSYYVLETERKCQCFGSHIQGYCCLHAGNHT